MSELSEVYAVDESFSSQDIGDGTYEWSRPTTPAPYYQHYGEGTIDQSIFVTQLPNDVYSFNAYLSQTLNNQQVYVAKNNFRKLNNCACFSSGTSPWSMVNGEYMGLVQHGKFSPASIDYSIDWTQRFYVNFLYGQTLLIPRIDGWAYNTQGDSGVYINGTSIDDFLYQVSYNNKSNYLICGISLTGGIKYGSGLLPNSYFKPVFIQFAGNLHKIKYNVVTGNWWQATDEGDNYGVFLCCASRKLFEGPEWDGNGRFTPRPGTPYDVNALCEKYTASWGQTYMGLTDISQVYAIMDRLGYYWSKNPDSDATQLGARCADPDVRCPIIDTENGNLVTTTVLSGDEIAGYSISHPDSNMAWDVGAIDRNGKTYLEIRIEFAQPAQPTTEEADEIDLNVPVIATTGGNTLWIMNETQVKQFFTWLWDPDGNKFDDIVKGCALLGENPMDSIISLRMYPLQLTTYLQYSQHSICFGRTDSELSNFYVTSSNVIVIDLGSFYFNDSGMFNDFRDYEPYSRYSLYVPFCGIIPLSAIECINTDISIKMIIDLVTGACTAVIYTNKVPYKYLDGMIGIEVPVTGRNMSGYAQTVLGAALGGAGGGLALGSKADKAARAPAQSRLSQYNALNSMSYGGLSESPSSYNAMSDVGKAMGTMSPALGMATAVGGAAIAGTVAALSNAPAVESKGSNTPAMGIAKPLYPYFIVQRSDCWMPENYAKLYGRPLNEGGKIGDFSGYSEFGNINLDGISGATSAEKTLIADLLTSGVYL